MHAYYDAVILLAGCLLVLLAGGNADAGDHKYHMVWTWIVLGLTIVAWLYAPFIFNPYMFNAEAFFKDIRAWWGFFLCPGRGHEVGGVVRRKADHAQERLRPPCPGFTLAPRLLRLAGDCGSIAREAAHAVSHQPFAGLGQRAQH